MRALALLSLLAWVQPKEMESVNARKNFWSFRPVRKPSLPPVKNAAWCISPVDRFVLAKWSIY